MKPTGYFVTYREACKLCHGVGVTSESLYAEFWAWRNRPGNTVTTERQYELDRAWWRERGYDMDGPMPPEEIPCPDCDGTGYTEREVPLRDALAALHAAEQTDAPVK